VHDALVEPPVFSPEAVLGQVALITGGGTGIGAATALALARSGASVAICGRRHEPIATVRSELEGAGAPVLALGGVDVREPDQAAGLVDAVLERFGRIDVLVNNAGGQFAAPAEQISAKGWRAVHRLNVDAVWNLTRSVAERSMIPSRQGLVVFIGFSPRRGVPFMIHSSAARAALENLAGGIAIEWSRYGIRAVCVSCGAIDTEGLRGYGQAWIDEAAGSVPLGRLGTPEEVASTITFLASAGGRYITGTTIVVDGGADAWGFGIPPPRVDPP
jgi:citronellol/citronellal dehydrogenase